MTSSDPHRADPNDPDRPRDPQSGTNGADGSDEDTVLRPQAGQGSSSAYNPSTGPDQGVDPYALPQSQPWAEPQSQARYPGPVGSPQYGQQFGQYDQYDQYPVPRSQPAQPPAGFPYGQPGQPYDGQYGPAGGIPTYPGYSGPGPGYGGYPGGHQTPGTNGLSIASLCCSIVAFLATCLWIPGVIIGSLSAILGITFGVIAMSQVKSRMQQGHGVALAGVIVGAVYLTFVAVLIVLVVIAVAGRNNALTLFLSAP